MKSIITFVPQKAGIASSRVRISDRASTRRGVPFLECTRAIPPLTFLLVVTLWWFSEGLVKLLPALAKVHKAQNMNNTGHVCRHGYGNLTLIALLDVHGMPTTVMALLTSIFFGVERHYRTRPCRDRP